MFNVYPAPNYSLEYLARTVDEINKGTRNKYPFMIQLLSSCVVWKKICYAELFSLRRGSKSCYSLGGRPRFAEHDAATQPSANIFNLLYLRYDLGHTITCQPYFSLQILLTRDSSTLIEARTLDLAS